MGFTFTFPTGFTIVWFDSVGDPNADERALASELAPVDVAIFPWTPHPISATQLDDLPATKFIEPLYRTPICVDTRVTVRSGVSR